MPVIINGNGTVDTGTVLVGNSDITGLAAGALPANVIGAGAVLQVVSQQNGQNITTLSSAFTMLTQSFTPTSASSKVLVLMSYTVERNGGNSGNYILVSTKRDSTTIVSNWGNASGYQEASGTRAVAVHTYLDSPATTSAVSYTMVGDFSAGGTGVPWQFYSLQLTLLEIAA